MSAPAELTPFAKRILPALVAVAFFMEALDTTILNTAVPTISEALNVKPLDMKAVLASYTLSLAVFIPISGWMADRFGTRRIFAAAIGLFSLGSLLCGLANDIHLLVACRVLQGLGGAMMIPVGRLTVIRTFAKSELLRTMSFIAIPGLIGPMLGPLAGGLIVAYLHWRVIFFVNLPIGVLGLVMVYLHLPDYREEHRHPLDVVGLILFGSGVALLSYVLEVFGEHTLSTREILALLAVALTLLAGYGLHATHTRFPLLRLNVFKFRTFAVSTTGSFITRIGIGGGPFLLPLMYQVGLGYSPVQSGLLIMPQVMGAMSSKVVVQRLLRRIGYRRMLVCNTVILGCGLMLFATIGPDTPAWRIVLQAFLYGICTSLQYTSMNTLAYADVAPAQTSNATSIASTLQQMSMSFGVATAGLCTAFFVPEAVRNDPALFVAGIHKAFAVLGLYTIAVSLMFYRLKAGDGSNVSQQKTANTGDANAAS